MSFIRRARDLSFTLEAVRELLTLSNDKTQSCDAVDGIARVLSSCSHGTVADCKIIETLAPRGKTWS